MRRRTLESLVSLLLLNWSCDDTAAAAAAVAPRHLARQASLAAGRHVRAIRATQPRAAATTDATDAPAPAPRLTDARQLPAVSIEYCTRCNWMLRSAWLAQELLTTFNGTLAEVRLRPNHQGGVFIITVDTPERTGRVVWDRAIQRRFPESKELKQKVRDRIDPERSLGHSDANGGGGDDDDDDDSPVERGSARTAITRLFSLLRRGQMRRTVTEAAQQVSAAED